MKKVWLALVSLLIGSFFIPSFSQTQIPNGNFSTWSNDTTASGWDGAIGVDVMIYTFNLNNMYRTSDAHSAPYACMVKTEKTVPILGMLLPGMASLGNQQLDILSLSFVFGGGAPISVKPTKVKGYFKYTCPALDTMAIIAVCKKNSDTIAYGDFAVNQNVSNYTYFEFDMNYSQSLTPDTIDIVLIASAGYSAKSGSIVYVDDIEIEYDGAGGPETISLDDIIQAYPNPASDIITIDCGIDAVNRISIFDVSGRLVFNDELNGKTFSLDSRQFEKGIYFLEIENVSGKGTKKLIITR